MIKGFCQECSAKLERDGKVVIGYNDGVGAWTFKDELDNPGTHRALLINIEPIEKKMTEEYPNEFETHVKALEEFLPNTDVRHALGIKKCTHPKEKIEFKMTSDPTNHIQSSYQCECGVRVRIKQDGFEELK